MSDGGSNRHRYRFRRAFLHPRYWSTWAGLGFYFMLTRLPLPVTDWLGCRLGVVAAKKNRKRYAIVRTNLSLCFPEKTAVEIESLVLQHFQAQYRSLMHYAILWWSPVAQVRKKIEHSGFEQIEHYRQQGKNIIILLSHTVGLDFAVAAIAMDYETTGIYKTFRNPVLDWQMANGRLRFGARHGGKLFSREDGLKPLLRETRHGKLLVYLADEDLGARNSVFVPFFGVQKATIPLLGRLAKSCDAVVLPCVSCYQPETRCYTVSLLPVIKSLSGTDEISDSVQMNKAIEASLLQCPLQYLWTLRYFQTRPPGESSFYD